MECSSRAVVARWGYRLALASLRMWWAIRRPRSDGVRCVLRHGEAFVLVRHSYGDSRWMLPGGRMRRGESALETSAREMIQELGVAATQWRELGYLPARTGYWRTSRSQSYRRHGTHFVTANVHAPTLAVRAAELLDAGWFTVERLPAGCSDALDVAIANGWLQ